MGDFFFCYELNYFTSVDIWYIWMYSIKTNLFVEIKQILFDKFTLHELCVICKKYIQH